MASLGVGSRDVAPADPAEAPTATEALVEEGAFTM